MGLALVTRNSTEGEEEKTEDTALRFMMKQGQSGESLENTVKETLQDWMRTKREKELQNLTEERKWKQTNQKE